MTKERSIAPARQNSKHCMWSPEASCPSQSRVGGATRGMDPPSQLVARACGKRDRRKRPSPRTQDLSSNVQILKLEDSCPTPRRSGVQGPKRP